MKIQKKNMMLPEHLNLKIIIVQHINNNNIKTQENINLHLNITKIRIISILISFIY